jgi:ribonuclease T1
MTSSSNLGNDSRKPGWRPTGWLRIGLIAVVLGVFAYRQWQEQQRPANQPAAPAPSAKNKPAPQADDAAPAAEQREAPAAPTTGNSPKTKLFNQTIYDQDGKVAYRGNIDLGPTLARIQRHERLDFPNDGVTFQNRERRLPQQPAGYYHEYVHPTPGLRGPGPQRVVTGKEGEIFYTADHYRTFQRLDQP